MFKPNLHSDECKDWGGHVCICRSFSIFPNMQSIIIFVGSFYYALVVLTLIGYGHSTPNTGRICDF